MQSCRDYIFGTFIAPLLLGCPQALAQQSTNQSPIQLVAQLKELTDASASIVVRVQNTSTNAFWINKDDLRRDNITLQFGTPKEGLSSRTISSHHRRSAQPDVLLQPQGIYENTVVFGLAPNHAGPPRSFFEKPEIRVWVTLRIRLPEQKEYSRVRLNVRLETNSPTPHEDSAPASPTSSKPEK